MILTLKWLALFLLVAPFPFLLQLHVAVDWLCAYVKYVSEPANPAIYDYIVVGAGSAGSVVAGRLAQAGQSVLLVEAGGASPWAAHVPLFVGQLQRTVLDWRYQTVPQAKAGLGAGGVANWPRGKLLGGSSMLNYMLYIRGHKGDYDEWEGLGLDGWSWEDVLPYFKKSENYSEENDNLREHGRDGPMVVTTSPYTDGVTKAFLEAGKELGYDVGDINTDLRDGGFTISHTTTSNGKRPGTFKTFAEKYVGTYLTVMTFTHVRKVIVEDLRAVGIEVSRFGDIQKVIARKEVILSAGTVGSPQILMLSGVGDSEELQSAGVNPVHHLPDVGKNLQDHLISPITVDVNPGQSLNILSAFQTFPEWIQNGTGPFAAPGGCTGLAHVRSDSKSDKRPAIQVHMASLTHATDMGLVLFDNFNLEGESWKYIQPHVGRDSAAIIATLNRPKSRGSIKLRNSDPFSYPIIDPNYLGEEEDIQAFVSGLKFCTKIAETKAFGNIGANKWGKKNDPYCGHMVDEDEYLRCYVMTWSFTSYHPTGTCAMGKVTDEKLKVKGLEGLRVVDASVMPIIVGGNTNAPTIMIAEKAADMILQDARQDASADEKSITRTKEEL